MSENVIAPCSHLRGPDWVTTTVAMRLLAMPREAVYRAMNAGELKFSQTPGGWRKIHRADMAAYQDLLAKRLRIALEEGITDAVREQPEGPQ